ncbi:hypothetical protein EB796_013556 [Bugula neritina]|uniref:Secreted protein n=1 Tax=Bugula neritina TaxID=10212 RepID=A0A7J7JQH6_BUGNE|nr:hypothetical protein EB796_013556 [Bugula neritina]
MNLSPFTIVLSLYVVWFHWEYAGQAGVCSFLWEQQSASRYITAVYHNWLVKEYNMKIIKAMSRTLLRLRSQIYAGKRNINFRVFKQVDFCIYL